MIKRDDKGRFVKGNKLPANWGGVRKAQNSPFWKGDNAGYWAIHTWVRKTLGRATKCSSCGETNKRIEWANISGKYKRDINDWKQLCCKCHAKFDDLSEIQKGKNNTSFGVKHLTPRKIRFSTQTFGNQLI